MITDVDTCLRDLTAWYIDHRQEMTEPELNAILIKHCGSKEEAEKFTKFLETEPGQLRFKTLLSERKKVGGKSPAVEGIAEVGIPNVISQAPAFDTVGYRVDIPNWGIPKQATAADVVRFEQKELGNELGVSPQMLAVLEKFNHSDVVWITRNREDARYYLSEGMTEKDISLVKQVKGGKIVAEDGQGGFLVLLPRARDFKPKKLDVTQQKLLIIGPTSTWRQEWGARPPIIHTAITFDPESLELLPPEIDVNSAFPEGAESNLTAEERAIVDRLIEEIPDKNDPFEINYFQDMGDKKVYLEGWGDVCLTGTGFTDITTGGRDDKIEFMVRDAGKTLFNKAKEENLILQEGGFREFEAGARGFLYGATWGVYDKTPSS